MPIKTKTRVSTLSIVLGVTCLLIVALPGVTAAIDSGSTIKAEVCDNSPPAVTITSPQSDSIVNQPVVSLAGSAVRTSQIDIFVNNQYASSVAIDSSQVFSVDIGLDNGTNSIRTTAFYSCNNTTAEETVVVSYEPSSTPGSGNDTSTVTIAPSNPGPGVISNPIKAQNYKNELYDRSEINKRAGRTLLDRLGTSLGFNQRDGQEWEYDFTWQVAAKTSWLLLAIGSLVVSFLASAQIVWVLSFFGLSVEYAFIGRKIFRLIALLLSFLFVILVLA